MAPCTPTLSKAASVRIAPFLSTPNRPASIHIKARQRRLVASAAPEDSQAEQMAAMQEALKNPEVAAQVKAMEEQMKNPEVQDQMQQMTALMSNPQYMQRMGELRDDPELKPIFDEIRTGGMAAMMKFMNDPAFLSKIGEKMGDMSDVLGGNGGGGGGGGVSSQPPTVAATAAGSAANAPPPVVNDILDAARYGDVEAIEDYMAIGKGEKKDENGRSALHYAVAYNMGTSAKALLDNGADVNVTDEEGNTPLHFAAGYGRSGAVRALLAAKADPSTKNAQGKTAVDLIKEEARNPLNTEADLLSMLS